MDESLHSPSAKSAGGIFVEVIGHDGLVHHVGPFKSREQAEAWIAQTSPEKVQRQDHAPDAVASANFRNLKPRLAE